MESGGSANRLYPSLQQSTASSRYQCVCRGQLTRSILTFDATLVEAVSSLKNFSGKEKILNGLCNETSRKSAGYAGKFHPALLLKADDSAKFTRCTEHLANRFKNADVAQTAAFKGALAAIPLCAECNALFCAAEQRLELAQAKKTRDRVRSLQEKLPETASDNQASSANLEESRKDIFRQNAAGSLELNVTDKRTLDKRAASILSDSKRRRVNSEKESAMLYFVRKPAEFESMICDEDMMRSMRDSIGRKYLMMDSALEQCVRDVKIVAAAGLGISKHDRTQQRAGIREAEIELRKLGLLDPVISAVLAGAKLPEHRASKQRLIELLAEAKAPPIIPDRVACGDERVPIVSVDLELATKFLIETNDEIQSEMAVLAQTFYDRQVILKADGRVVGKKWNLSWGVDGSCMTDGGGPKIELFAVYCNRTLGCPRSVSIPILAAKTTENVRILRILGDLLGKNLNEFLQRPHSLRFFYKVEKGQKRAQRSAVPPGSMGTNDYFEWVAVDLEIGFSMVADSKALERVAAIKQGCCFTCFAHQDEFWEMAFGKVKRKSINIGGQLYDRTKIRVFESDCDSLVASGWVGSYDEEGCVALDACDHGYKHAPSVLTKLLKLRIYGPLHIKENGTRHVTAVCAVSALLTRKMLGTYTVHYPTERSLVVKKGLSPEEFVGRATSASELLYRSFLAIGIKLPMACDNKFEAAVMGGLTLKGSDCTKLLENYVLFFKLVFTINGTADDKGVVRVVKYSPSGDMEIARQVCTEVGACMGSVVRILYSLDPRDGPRVRPLARKLHDAVVVAQKNPLCKLNSKLPVALHYVFDHAPDISEALAEIERGPGASEDEAVERNNQGFKSAASNMREADSDDEDDLSWWGEQKMFQLMTNLFKDKMMCNIMERMKTAAQERSAVLA